MLALNERTTKTLRLAGLLTVGVLASFAFAPGLVFAQPSVDSLPVAETIPIADPEVSYGDIILYDNQTDLYRLSQVENDTRFYGIVIEDPTLLIETDAELVPVVRGGRVPVNVTLENGEIAAGDAIVTSSTDGKGMRADEEHIAIFGFAVEPLTEADGTTITNEEGEEVSMGTVLVEVGGPRVQALIEEQEAEEEAKRAEAEGKLTGTVIARYSFAALVALGSIFVTFYTFLSSIRSGVISIGRNPRAKAAIRSMVVLNVALALIITAIGVFFAISLLVVST